MVSAEGLLRIRIDAACHGAARHEEGQVPAHDKHDRRAGNHRDDRAGRTCGGQEGRPRHREDAPADHAAERDRPHSDLT